MRVAAALVDQEGFAVIALEQARQAERMLKPEDELPLQMQVLESLAQILRKAKKGDEVKPIEARLLKLEARDYLEYMKATPIKIEEYKGRKAKSDRAVLVELFTGVEAESCVPMELAYDAVQSTFKPAEVIVMQYHIPFGGFDALTLQDGIARLRGYATKAQPGPSLFINGKKDETGGAARNAAKLKYTAYREAIEEALEKPATVKIQLTASQKGGDISIKGLVSELEKPGEKITLRFVLTEERIRYIGGNGVRYHHNVVRSFPGGVKGFPLPKKDAEATATVNLEKLREEISKQLEEFTKEDGDTPSGDRPLALKNLRVIAFVQDDATGDVLQAVQVEVEEKKE